MADEKKVGGGLFAAGMLALLAIYFRSDIKSAFKCVAQIVKDFVEWLEKTFDDPALTAAIQDDLGLDPTNPATPPRLDDATKTKIDEFVAKEDVDQAAVVEFFTDLKPLFDQVMAFVDAVNADAVDARTLFVTMFRLFAVQSLRVRNPSGFALVQLLGLLTADPETYEQIDAAHLVKLVSGDTTPADDEAFVQRLSSVLGVAAVIAAEKWEALGGVVDAMYGWDPDPEDEGTAAVIASRALTVVLASELLEPARPAFTVIGVPASHGGPGVFVSISSPFEFSTDTEDVRYTMELGDTGHFGVLIRNPLEFAFDTKPSLRVGVEPITADGQPDPGPALVVGADEGTRLEVGRLSYGVEVGADNAAFLLGAKKGRLVIRLSDGDSFLQQLPGGSVEAPFDLSMIADTSDGIRFQGGTGLKVNLPVAATAFGVFTVQFLELELQFDPTIALEIRGGFSFHIGPFAASIDRVGMTIALSDGDPDIEQVPDMVQFAPPRGIGLVLSSGPVKGGGYLFVDSDRGEYAGALELKFGDWLSIKAIGLLSTKRKDGTDGWSLLLFIYGQFSLSLGFGIFLTGVGGMIGLHHRSDVEALKAGMKTGALDDVLFPEDPIADAPRIINRLLELFPIEESNFLIGPMLELSFSKPPVVYVRLGVILDYRNAVQSDTDRSLSKVILLGQVLVQLPPKETHAPAILTLLIDIVGFYEPATQFLLIRARLRNSFVGTKKVGKITLSGELLFAAQFGADANFVFSAGGFHPKYEQSPPRVPTDLERLKGSFKIGKMIKLSVEVYFAVTPNSYQFGFKGILKADFKVASIEASLSFDSLLSQPPRCFFVVDIEFKAKVKAFGRTLMSVTVTAMVAGPDEWQMAGSFSFKIAFWKKSVSFDERWGEQSIGDISTVFLASTLQAELSDPDNLTTDLPVGGVSPITLDTGKEAETIAHPLGRLAIRQRAVPFDLDIDRIGTERLVGGRQRVSIDNVTVNGSDAVDVEPTIEVFAKSQFMELTESERLTGKVFEPYPNGVTVGGDEFRSDDQHAREVAAAFETVRLDPEPKAVISRWFVVDRVLLPETHESAVITSSMGAAARSAQAVVRQRMASTLAPHAVAVADPPLVTVTPGTLVGVGAPNGAGPVSPSLIEQAAAEQGLNVVEAFEVVG